MDGEGIEGRRYTMVACTLAPTTEPLAQPEPPMNGHILLKMVKMLAETIVVSLQPCCPHATRNGKQMYWF